MIRTVCTLATVIAVASHAGIARADVEQLRTTLADAEDRFQAPDMQWFLNTREALREEVTRINEEFADAGEDVAVAWKQYLHWELLERNLGELESVNLAEVGLVRRWLYSNQKGLESPFFRELRLLVDAYYDAAFSLAADDLHASFRQQVAAARSQGQALLESPSDSNAVAIGQTLGWFARTGQLTSEVDELRRLLSSPNATLQINSSLIGKITERLAIPVEETLSVSNQVSMPGSGRALNVFGTATTTGQVAFELRPNDEAAELSLIFQGWVESQTQAAAGPVTIYINTSGDVEASKPLYFSPRGLEFGATSVFPQVSSNVTGVAARSRIIRRIGSRRANRPETRSQMNAEARSTTGIRLRQQFDDRVAQAFQEMQSGMGDFRTSFDSIADVIAPVFREGAAPDFHSARTTASGLELNISAASRFQIAAPTPRPAVPLESDIQLEVHSSVISNTAETMLGGKRLTDRWFMRYAEILHSELPLPLMVHDRAKRWAIRAEKLRPIELRLDGPRRFTFVVRSSSLEVDGREYSASCTATVEYQLVQNEFDEFSLERVGPVQLESELPDDAEKFWHTKLSAFFGPVLDAGGVVMPDSGVIGTLRKLRLAKLKIDGGWLSAAWSVPSEVIDEILAARRQATDSAG